MEGRCIGAHTAEVRPNVDADVDAGVTEDEALLNAAWAALMAGRPRELRALERLLDRVMAEGCRKTQGGPERGASLRRLELLLASTARNLRVMRGQWRMG